MKSWLAFGTVLLLLASFASAADVIITEVLYDPVNESGGEAVELYNQADAAISIGGWIVATEASANDATIPAGTVIRPRSHFLIADQGWSALSEVKADYEEALTLANSDAGIAIVSNGTIIDAVGWGNGSNIGSGLFEGAPAAGVAEGQSLGRKTNSSHYIDTGNNSFDFSAATPGFRNSSSAGSSEILVFLSVTSTPPAIHSLNITEDDDLAAGIQLMPLPLQNSSVRVVAIVSPGSEENVSVQLRFGNSTLAMQLAETINSTTSAYAANISIPFHQQPGLYNISASVNSQANATTAFEVMRLLSMEVDTGSISFSAPAGGTSEVIGDLSTSTGDRITVRNTGNTPLNLYLSATNLSSVQGQIPSERLRYSFDGNYTSSLSGNLTAGIQRVGLNLPAGIQSLGSMSVRLDIPQAAGAGNYTGRIFIGASS
ncbi:lamin tail domain-containing protein [Candidatus Woesearchaeota archaeon]|nr:lamin tail domain-containing protein [Candidatus Woesearchaeota archaeon]